MNKQTFGVRVWLWCIFAVVIVISLGYIAWASATGNSAQIASPEQPAKTAPAAKKTITPPPVANTPNTNADNAETPPFIPSE